MSLRLLFNDSTTGPEEDTLCVLAFINNFFDGIGVTDVQVNISSITAIMNGMRADFPHVDGLEGASPFKKAANFLCYFVAESPVSTKLPDELKQAETEMGGMLKKLPADPANAIIAFEIVCEALHTASLERKDGIKTLDNKIQLSNHSYVDVIGALSNITPLTSFALVAVLLEQMTYKTNPECQYPCE